MDAFEFLIYAVVAIVIISIGLKYYEQLKESWQKLRDKKKDNKNE